MICIKTIFKKIILLSNKRFSTRKKNLSSIYLQWKQICIYECNKILTQVTIYKVLLPMLFVKNILKVTAD